MAVLYLLDALRSCPSARTVIVGSRLKYTVEPGRKPEPPHPYSLSKALEEMVSLSWMSLFGQQIMLAEPGNLIGAGPSTGICSLLARHVVACEQEGKREAFRLSGRDNTRDFLDVRDAVRAYATLLVHGTTGTVYPVVSGRSAVWAKSRIPCSPCQRRKCLSAGTEPLQDRMGLARRRSCRCCVNWDGSLRFHLPNPFRIF